MDFLIYGLPTIKTVFVTIGSYAAVSILFYHYPHLIHRKKANKPKKRYNFVVVSHRGGSGENKENTLSAFRYSHEIGTDVIELDCHITKDGKVVVAHDNNLSRLCGVNKLISELNYEDLPELLEEHDDDIFLKKTREEYKDSANSKLISKKLQHRQSRELLEHSRRIPLLEDVFKSFPNMLINLDVKINDDNLIRQVNELIIKYNREKLTVWGSFKEEVTRKLHKLNPNIEIYFSLKGVIKLFFLKASGLLPFVPLRESYFEVIMPNFILKRFIIRKSFVRHLQKRGISVYYWVLNTDEEFKHAIELGVDGIITDFPSRLIQFIENNQQLKQTLVRPENNNNNNSL